MNEETLDHSNNFNIQMNNRAQWPQEHLQNNPLEGRLVSLDTLNSTSPSRPWQTSWRITRDNFIGLKGFLVSVRSIEFSNSVYNVNSNYDTIYVSENGGTYYPVTIAHGNYNHTLLRNAIEDALNNSPDLTLTYDVSFELLTYKFTISTVLPDVISFQDGDYSLYHIIGFDSNNFGRSAAVHIASTVMNLSGTSCIYVTTNIIKENFSATSLPGLLAAVPVNAAFGETVYWEPSTLSEFLVPAGGIEILSIRVFDDRIKEWQSPGNHPIRINLFLRPLENEARKHLPLNFS